jgi:succinate-semialdehyde dehydrogenase/glutarate-semialdehyde dehydrogenase
VEKISFTTEAGFVVVSDPRLPLAELKWLRKELAAYGIREFMNTKTIWIA